MTADEQKALKDAAGYAAAGRVRYSPHAQKRIEERCGGADNNVLAAIKSATKCTAQDNGRYRLTGGVDIDGDDMTVIILFDDGVLVVTLF